MSTLTAGAALEAILVGDVDRARTLIRRMVEMQRLSVIEAATTLRALVRERDAELEPALHTTPDDPDQSDAAPRVYREQLAVQWPPTQDDPRGPIQEPDYMLRDDLAAARAREVADLYAHEGAHLVRLVTTVHPIP